MLKSKLVIAVVGTFMGVSAFAQNPEFSTAAPVNTVSANVANSNFSTSAGDKAEKYNPFSGQPLSLEQQQLQVEKAKLYTQFLEELLRASSLSEDIRNVPVKKRAEIATHLGGDAGKFIVSTLPGYAGIVPQEKKEAPPPPAPRKKALPMVRGIPATDIPRVTSVMDMGGDKTAVLTNTMGVAYVVKEGDSTVFGKIGEITSKSVTVNGRAVPLEHSSVQKFTVSDVAPQTDAAGKPLAIAKTGSNPLPPPLPTALSVPAETKQVSNNTNFAGGNVPKGAVQNGNQVVIPLSSIQK